MFCEGLEHVLTVTRETVTTTGLEGGSSMASVPEWKKKQGTHERIGAAIRAEREANELSQANVAKSVGCSPSTISYVERGGKMKGGSVEVIEAICWALGIDLARLDINERRHTPIRRYARAA
jgi:ribosome-binding protein aMBF1 (putative translation factor)